MAPIIFFAFETLACTASYGLARQSDICQNASYSSSILSGYMILVITYSLASNAVSRDERGDGLTYENLTILRLKMRQKIQGALGVVTALAAMYLFSVLGVQGATNDTNYRIGAVGGVTLFVALLIEGYVLVFGESRGGEYSAETSEAPRSDLSGTREFRSNRRLSMGKVTDDMIVSGLV